MNKIQNDIHYYYNEYLQNIEKSKHLFEIKELNLKNLKIKENITLKNKFKFLNFKKVANDITYYPLVIKDNNEYILFDSFNQFLNYDEDVMIKCIILPNEVFKIINNNLEVIDSEALYFEDIYLNICDMHNKFFMLYPYKNLLNKEYRVYIIRVSDYINLLEAISNLIQLINEKLIIIHARGVK